MPREFHRNEAVFNKKVIKIKTRSRDAAKSNPVVKMLAKYLGICQSMLPAIAVAPSHFSSLLSDIIKALEGSRKRQDWQSVVCLSPETKKELEWWRDYVKMNNGRSTLYPVTQDTVFTDASKQGWRGTFKSNKDRGMMELR